MAIAEGAPEVDMPALPELAQFVVPVIQGSVHQISDLQLVTSSADYSGSLTLVARRSSQRPGVRHWRRGAAPDVSASPGCMQIQVAGHADNSPCTSFGFFGSHCRLCHAGQSG